MSDLLVRRATPADHEAAGAVTVAAYEEFTEGPDDQYVAKLRDAIEHIAANYEAREYGRALRHTMELADEVNAYVDGAKPLRVFLSVVVPAVRPAMAVLAMLTFLMAWNDFFWPIITLSSQNPTVQVSFQSLATGYAPQQSIIMAGTLYGTVPVLVVFGLLGRHIVGGIMQGAVKG